MSESSYKQQLLDKISGIYCNLDNLSYETIRQLEENISQVTLVYNIIDDDIEITNLNARILIYDGLLRIGRPEIIDAFYDKLKETSDRVGIEMADIAGVFHQAATRIDNKMGLLLIDEFYRELTNSIRPKVEPFGWIENFIENRP